MYLTSFPNSASIGDTCHHLFRVITHMRAVNTGQDIQERIVCVCMLTFDGAPVVISRDPGEADAASSWV